MENEWLVLKQSKMHSFLEVEMISASPEKYADFSNSS